MNYNFRLVDLPPRPFKNFDEYLQERRKWASHGKDRLYPCHSCNGSGRIIAPYEKPDPIEGYKLADTVNCYLCCGSGEVRREQALASYKEVIKDWKGRYDKNKQRRELQKKLIKKIKNLSKEELSELRFIL